MTVEGANGRQLAIDLEVLGSVTVVGDTTAAADLVRRSLSNSAMARACRTLRSSSSASTSRTSTKRVSTKTDAAALGRRLRPTAPPGHRTIRHRDHLPATGPAAVRARDNSVHRQRRATQPCRRDACSRTARPRRECHRDRFDANGRKPSSRWCPPRSQRSHRSGSSSSLHPSLRERPRCSLISSTNWAAGGETSPGAAGLEGLLVPIVTAPAVTDPTVALRKWLRPKLLSSSIR